MYRPHTSLTRRHFLYGTGALATGALLPGVLFANTGGSARLVVVVLRGALDGLAAVPPYGDRDYAGLRRELAIAPPGETGGSLDLDSPFGLAPPLGFFPGRFR